MVTDPDDLSPTIGTTTPMVDVFVILMTFFVLLTGSVRTIIHEDPFMQSPDPVHADDVAATITVGPGESIQIDERPCDLAGLRDELAGWPADATVALRVQPPVEYDVAYRVRYTVRAAGVAVQELSPAPALP